MKQAKKMARQGDVLFIRMRRIPEDAEQATDDGRIVVAHSETGHHHAIDDLGVIRFEVRDPLVCYLQIDATCADVVHHRDFHTHETVRLPKGNWQVRRQREHTPEGFRRVAD